LTTPAQITFSNDGFVSFCILSHISNQQFTKKPDAVLENDYLKILCTKKAIEESMAL